MENDALFNYIKLIVDNGWIILLLLGVLWAWTHPAFLSRLSSVQFGDIKLELRELQQRVEFLQERNAQLGDVISSFDANAPLRELERPKGQLKSIATRLKDNDLAQVRAGLQPGASAEQVYAAAEIARARRDPVMFDDLIGCLARLADDKNLHGIRLHTVWTLTSAVHRTLIADMQHTARPSLTQKQLKAAAAVLERLVQNPRVLADRPDVPSKGVRGPARNAMAWIEKGLKQPDGADE